MNKTVEPSEHDLEHVAAEIHNLGEDGRNKLKILSRVSRVDDPERTLAVLEERELVRRDGETLELTAQGQELAERQVRLYRLAEVLLSTVLQVEDNEVVDETACGIEHVLHPSVTESVCSFLGPPKFSPHGKPIPAGSCCRTLSNSIEPLVPPLDKLAVGHTARVVYIVPKDPKRLVRLSNLGLTPGSTIMLQQKRPATEVAMGETTLALDHEFAAEIYVKRLS